MAASSSQAELPRRAPQARLNFTTLRLAPGPSGIRCWPLSGHTATLLGDGRVLIAGGEGSGAPGSTLEIFNPATSSFSAAGTLVTPRKNHAAVLLSGGRVMIVGGFDGSHVLNSTEIFDPATTQVSSGPSLS